MLPNQPDGARNQPRGESKNVSGHESNVVHDPHRGRRGFLMGLKILEVRLRFIVILVAVGLVIGYWDTIKNYWDKWTRPAAESVSELPKDTEFYCPMHPNVVRQELDPGGQIPKCPICGMPLSKRKKGEVPELPEGVTSRVQLSPDRIRLAGIQTVPVTYQPLVKEVNAVGFVDYDESRLARIVTRVDGYIDKLLIDRTWITVRKGDPLAEIYSGELYSTAQDLRDAVGRNDPFTSSIRKRMRLLGVSDAEIDEIVRSGQAKPLLVIRSPQAGHVIRKEVREGDQVQPGKILFEVADLSVVWIEADVYERDIPFLRVGQSIEARVEALPNRVFNGKVTLVHPHLEPTTRTNSVRLELENPKHELRPGMFASVRIQQTLAEIEPFKSIMAAGPLSMPAIRSAEPREVFECPDHPAVMMDKPGTCPKCAAELASRPLNEDERLIWWCPMHPKVSSDKSGDECEDCSGMKLVPKLLLLAQPGEVLAVPERSVVDTGSRKIAYVEREPGLFEGVEIEVGPRTGSWYPVVKGLTGGDRVAAAGAFLIDAETRLNPAAASTYMGASGGPQAGKSAAVQSNRTTASSAKNAAPAKTGTDKPAPVAAKLTADEIRVINQLAVADRQSALAQAICPISDEPLGSMGKPFKMTVKGQPVFLCCKGCEDRVNEDQDAALRRVAELKSTGTTGQQRK